jgi:NAD(P)-dependent dehydrogenase (short-subunit alcohol dehydrogenase family)
MAAWSVDSIPDQTGRIAVITGATSGLGHWCARSLARRGAEVVLAVRNAARGEAVAAEIRAEYPAAKVSVSELDLASLASVRDFAARSAGALPRIDVLLNNAGLGMQPTRHETKDGFEQQFGTNHLGHFALTGLLVPVLLRAPAPRVVTVASMAHRRGAMAWDDLQSQKNYSGRAVYSQSKLANLMLALELAARAKEQGSRLVSIGAHPGLALTGFLAATEMPGWMQTAGVVVSKLVGQSAEAGSWPSLYAAAMPDAANGEYWGPDGFLEIRGMPARGRVWPHATQRADWQRLWTESEKLTGVVYPPLA